MPSLAASRRSSGTVIAPAPLPVPFEAPRLRAAALAPSRPRSRRVSADSFEIVFFLRAPDWAFLTFLRAAFRCFSVAMARLYPGAVTPVQPDREHGEHDAPTRPPPPASRAPGLLSARNAPRAYEPVGRIGECHVVQEPVTGDREPSATHEGQQGRQAADRRPDGIRVQ